MASSSDGLTGLTPSLGDIHHLHHDHVSHIVMMVTHVSSNNFRFLTKKVTVYKIWQQLSKSKVVATVMSHSFFVLTQECETGVGHKWNKSGGVEPNTNSKVEVTSTGQKGNYPYLSTCLLQHWESQRAPSPSLPSPSSLLPPPQPQQLQPCLPHGHPQPCNNP